MKTIYKRRKKQKKILEQQKHFSSSRTQPTNRTTTVPRYASSDMISTLPSSSQAMEGKSQSQILVEPNLPVATVYKNTDAIVNEPIEDFIDDDNRQPLSDENLSNQQTADIQETTQF